jgi:hypothetical protein
MKQPPLSWHQKGFGYANSWGSPPGPQPPTLPLEDDLFPPGLVGQIAQFIFDAAPRPVAKIALAAALGFMAGICGRAYNISATGLNQYILLLAPTGTGKEAIASGIEKLLSAIRLAVPASQEFVGPATIASEQALNKHLAKVSKSFVSLVGEFGITLRQICASNANSTQIGLRKILLDLYNKSGKSGVLRPMIYSDRDKNTEAVISPAFSLLGESTPESFYSTLDESMISEGLLPRFTIMEYRGLRPPLNPTHSQALPSKSLTESLAQCAAQALALMHVNNAIDVCCDERASQLLSEFDVFCTDQINGSSNEIIRHLWNRAHIKALKLGALVAVGVNTHEPMLTHETATWAIGLATSDVRNLIDRFEDGSIGKDDLESKQLANMLTAIIDYLTGSFSDVEGYGVPMGIFESRVVSLSFLHRKLHKTAPFRKDRLGATQAIQRAVKSLTEQGTIVEIGPLQRRERFGTNGRMFMLSDMWELRGEKLTAAKLDD